MKIGIIGLGDIAQKAYLPVISQIAGVELVLCTRNEATLTVIAKQYRIKETCCHYPNLLNHHVDAVMIHAATAIHPQIATFFLKQGIPVFVDKPLADSASACEALYEMAYRYHQPLYVGFNRRHIPLYNHHLGHNTELGSNEQLRALHWQKNRHNLAGEIRTFIFDDFIHPLDSINLNAKANLEECDIRWQMQGDELARLDVQWQHGGTILSASMDRHFGITNETVTARFDNESYQFDSFVTGVKYHQGEEKKLQLKDWTPMLASKGFEAMIQEWLGVIERGEMNESQVKRNLASHQLAEKLCAHVTRALKSKNC